jgi:hypothetical protein
MNEELSNQTSTYGLDENERAKLRLKALLSGIGKAITGGIESAKKEITSRPIQTLISTPISAARGFAGGTLESLGGLLGLSGDITSKIPLAGVIGEGEKQIGSGLYRLGELIKGKPTGVVEQAATGVGEWVLPFLIGAGETKLTLGLLSKTPVLGRISLLNKITNSLPVKSGLDLAFANQLMLDPLSTEEGREKVDRMKKFEKDFLFGTLVGIGGKALEPVAKGTIKVAGIPIEKVYSKIDRRLNEDFYRINAQILPDIIKQSEIAQSATEYILKRAAEKGETLDQYELQTITSRDFLDMVRGNKKPSEVFTTDFWKEIAKKYGLSEENYPVEITLPIKRVDESIYINGIAGLLKSPPELINEFKGYIQDVANEQMIPDDYKYGYQLEVVNMMIDDLAKKGYIVNKEKTRNLINRAIQFNRENARFEQDIYESDLIKGSYEQARERLGNYFTDLQRLKLYLGRFGEEKGYKAWENYLRKKGVGTDEVFEELRDAGYVYEDELSSPSRIIEIVSNIPSKKDIPEVRPPEPFNFEEEFRKLITPVSKEGLVETPYVVPRSIAEKTILSDLLQKEKTEVEGSTENLISNLSPEKQAEYQTIKGIINNSDLAPEDKINVSRYYSNLYIVDQADFKDPTQYKLVTNSLKSQARVWKEQIRTIATHNLGDGDARIRGIASVIESVKNALFTTPGIRGIFSVQNLLTSAKFGRPASLVQFMYTYVNPIRFLTRKTLDTVKSLVPKEEKELFADAFEKGTINELSEGSQRAAQIWKDYANLIIDIVNELRIELGKDPIPKIDKYFPRNLTKILVEAMNDDVKKNSIYRAEGTNHLLKRTLKELGELHSKDPDIALESYGKQVNHHIEYLLKELINRETKHWDEELRDVLLYHLKATPGLADRDIDAFLAGIFEKPGKALENALNKAGIIHTIKRMPLTNELREAILASPELSENPGVKELLKKGYWDLRKVDKESTYHFIRQAVNLPALWQLAMNSSFTVINTTQPMQEISKFGGFTSVPGIIKGYAKGYVSYPLKGIIKVIAPDFSDELRRTASLGRVLGFIEAKQSVWGEGVSFLDKFGIPGKASTLNLKLTELGNRVTSDFALRDRIVNKISSVTTDEARIMSSNLSATVNFISGRYVSPVAKKGVIGSGFLQYTQFPISDATLTLVNWQNILSRNKPIAEVYKNIFLSIGDKELMDKVIADIDKLSPGQLDSLFGLLWSGITMYTTAASVFSVFNVIHSINQGVEPYITTHRAKQEVLQTMIPGLGVLQRFQSGGAPTYSSTPRTDLTLPFQTPAISFAISLANMAQGLGILADGIFEGDPQKAQDGYDYFWLSVYNISGSAIQRIQDWYDFIDKGYVPKREIGSEKMQYTLQEGESPLTLLFFGRGSLAGYEELEKARDEELKVKALNEEAARVFMSALEEQDPIKKEQKLEIYKRLVLEKGAAPITEQGLRQRLIYRQLTAAERRLQTLPKVQRYSILQQLYGDTEE